MGRILPLKVKLTIPFPSLNPPPLPNLAWCILCKRYVALIKFGYLFYAMIMSNWATVTTVKPVFHLANLFARREAKTRIRQRHWLTLVGEKIRREQEGTVPTFFSVRANKFAKWKTGLREQAEQVAYQPMVHASTSCLLCAQPTQTEK